MSAKHLDLEKRLLHLISTSLLAVDESFDVSGDLFAAGLDSMAIMQLLLLIEEEVGVVIPAESVSRENFATVETLARLVRARLEERAGGLVPDAEASASEEKREVASSPPPPAEMAAVPAAEGRILQTFTRLPLLPCDFFVLGFDSMMREAGQGGHVAHSFLDLAALPDLARLREALRLAVERHPLLNAVLRRPWGVGLPEWRPAAEPQLPELALYCTADAPGALLAEGATRGGTLQELSEEVINRTLPPPRPEGWVKWRVSLIEETGGRCRLILSWSHLMLDGVGAELLLEELDALVTPGKTLLPPIEEPPPSRRHYGQRWANTTPMVNYFYELLKKPFECLGAPSLVPGPARFEVRTLDGAQSQAVAARAAALCGPLLNMPFHLAAAMRAHDCVFRERGERPASLMCNVPIQTRRKGARGPIFRNHLGMFFAALGEEELATIDGSTKSLLDRHARWLREKLDSSFDDLMYVMRPLPPKLHMAFVKRQLRGIFTSLFHSHTGEFAPGLRDFMGVSILNAYHVPGFSNPPGTGIFCSERDGRLSITMCWRDGVIDQKEKELMINQLWEDFSLI